MASISDYLGIGLQVGSTILGLGSDLARAEAAKAIGTRRAAEGEYEARQLEIEAESARGVGLRAAQDQVLKANLVNSAALARAAASNAGASDPTVMAIISRTAGEGAYRAALAMYEGEAQARLDITRSEGARFEAQTNVADAQAYARQARMSGLNTLLTGASKGLSMYERYWQGKQTGE